MHLRVNVYLTFERKSAVRVFQGTDKLIVNNN